ncbi:MAG: prephenate dehydratase [Solirubrobacteraceae bacterium]
MTAANAATDAGGAGGGDRIGYLGPQGTYTEEALLCDLREGTAEPVAFETIQDTIVGLRRGEVKWAIAPIENSLDGSVTVTLDLLADLAGEIEMIGETLLSVRHALVAAPGLQLDRIETVLTHPQAPGQCRAFLRERLSGARVLPASSTADAVRIASRSPVEERVAAIGTELAAQIYGGVVLASSIQDRADNLTRFAWLGLAGSGQDGPMRRRPASAGRKTSIVFWGAGADQPGWLVLCLDEFARRRLNLTKIESRPRRERMGHYMFFVDLEGGIEQTVVAEAIAGLSERCEEALVLGSFPAAARD